MVTPPYVPDRRDVVWIDLDPTLGREQAKRRPAIVISPRSYNQKTNLMLVCTITSEQKDYPFEVLLSSEKVAGVVLVDQVRALDWKVRETRFIVKAKPKEFSEIQDKLKLLID